MHATQACLEKITCMVARGAPAIVLFYQAA